MKVKFIFFISLFFLIGTRASGLESYQMDFKGFPDSLKGRDFFVKLSSPQGQQAFQSFKKQRDQKKGHELEKLCRQNISRVVCLVEPANGENIDPQNRECLPGSQSYAIYFERIYDHYPASFQRIFCSLKHIFIEKNFAGTAYAGTLLNDKGELDGAMMGIRRSVLDEELSLTTWASWKEQLSFGGITDSYTPTGNLPQIRTTSQTEANDFLYFVITHEFGHIFDFANQLNKTTECSDPTGNECPLAQGTWGSISWLTINTPKPANEFQNRSSLCFYWCDRSPLNPNQVPQVYKDLWSTDFISTYATRQPWDDFADSLAYFAMDQNLQTTYAINTKQGHIYDSMAKLHSKKFAQKREYLSHFINREDLIYP